MARNSAELDCNRTADTYGKIPQSHVTTSLQDIKSHYVRSFHLTAGLMRRSSESASPAAIVSLGNGGGPQLAEPSPRTLA